MTAKNTSSNNNALKRPNFIVRFFDKILDVLDGENPFVVEQSGGQQLTILYATQTGNAQTVAEDAYEQAKKVGLDVALRDMQDVDVAILKEVEHLLIVTSTFDNGGMPENAELLWESVCDPSAPMLNIQYAVLGLGDSSYLNFCQAGKEWDARLEGLGCQRIAERVDCDVDYEESAQAWIGSVIPMIANKYGLKDDNSVHSEAHKTAHEHSYHHNSHHPFLAILTAKECLTGKNSTKEVMHYELDISESGESYLEGDIIHIMPKNNAELVRQVLTYFDEKNVGEKVISQLMNKLEIRKPSVRLLQQIAFKAQDGLLTNLLQSSEIDDLEAYLWGKDSLSLLQKSGLSLSLAEFMATCQPLSARAYSIASSHSKYPNQVHITVRSVQYDADVNQEQRRRMQGVASTYLSDVLKQGDSVECYFSKNKSFKLPKETTSPVIMIGPGTGIAPFRAFLQERENSESKGDNWLFFGERNQATDFLYQSELESMQASGLLSKLSLAFSQDQQEKIYVQDRMRENGAELFAWIERGAYVYVCGDAKRMAKDVDKALHKVIEKFGHKSDLEAMDYIDRLRKTKRYVQDVY